MWLYSDLDYRLEYTNRCSALGVLSTKIILDILGALCRGLGIRRFAGTASDKEAKNYKGGNLEKVLHSQLLKKNHAVKITPRDHRFMS